MSEGLRNNYTPRGRAGRPQDRTEPRCKVFLVGSVIWDGRAERAHLLDVSASGARMHCAAPPAPDDRVEIASGALHMRGEVMWVQDGRFGVRFDRRLSPRELARVVG